MRHSGRIALFCFAAAGLLFVAQAHCGDLSRDAAWIGFAGAADLASTRYALQTCSSCREANPLAQSGAAQVAVKVAGTAGAVLICRELRKSGHPRVAKWFRWGVVAVWGGVAAHNLHVARTAR